MTAALTGPLEGATLSQTATTTACASWSVKEAAAVLGVGSTKMYELLRSGTVPHLRFGASLRIPRQALTDWMNEEAHRVLDAASETSR